VRDTHFLDSASGGTSEEMERKQESEGHPLPGYCIRRGGQMSSQKEERARSTHFLEGTEGGIIEDMKSKQMSRGHSLSGDHIGRVKSGYGKNMSRQGYSLST
jgi:hypothetical protein